MGYDLRLYIGEHVPYETARSTKKTPHNFSKNIATLELCVPDSDTLDAINKEQKTGKYVYIYDYVWLNDRDGDVYKEDKVNDDKYGERLKIIPAKKMLNILKKENAKDYYRRYQMAIVFLESLLDDFSPESLFVLPFGH
jgi:hypothetical protein